MKIDYLDLIIIFSGNYDYFELTKKLDYVFGIVPRDLKQVSRGNNTILIFKKIWVTDFNETTMDRLLRSELKLLKLSNLQTKYLIYSVGYWKILRTPILIIIAICTVMGTIFTTISYYKPHP